MKVAYESKVNATREPAAPINVHVLALIDDVSDAHLFAGGRRMADLVRQPPEAFLIWVKGAEQKVYLDGVERALRIRRIHKKVSDAVGLSPTFQKRAAPCPKCGEFSLGQWIGEDLIFCADEDCGLTLTLDAYEAYCLEKANE